MDFFHCSIGHISRSTGRSVVQNVAYSTGEILHEDRRELRADYANNRGAFWETMAPEGSGIAPDDLSFWDKLESFEDRYARVRFKNPTSLERYLTSARTGQTYEISLPKELSKEQQIDLIREMVATRFVSLGLMATYAIHEDEGNPHVHITVSTRTVWNGEISWEKGIARHLTSRYEFRESRRIFAGLINKHQELAGIPDRVDHRSYADRGIELIPTYHKGWSAHQLEKEEKYSRIVAENRKIFEENKERITEEPKIVLRELTSKQATFSERDVVKLVHKRLGDETGTLATHVIHSVLKQAVEVGIGFDDLKRYTSPEYKEKEDQVLESFQNYLGQKASTTVDGEKVGALLDGDASWLNEGQKNAVKTLCSDAKIAVMIGRAGTGKTTALQYVVQLYKQAGTQVLGMAPSATAAHELAKGAGCASDTIAHYAYYWRAYHHAVEKLADKNITSKERQYCEKLIAKYEKRLPTKNTLILVDEAGMVGVGGANNPIAGGWDAIIKTVNATGCKLILVGDDCQFKPVEAGDVFRKFVEVAREKGSLCTLDQIQRQTVPWMREASVCLSELKIGESLGMYEARGHIQQYDTDGQVYQEMARQYLRQVIREPGSESIVLAYTTAEIRELNGAIRKALKENGLLAQEDMLMRPAWNPANSEGDLHNAEGGREVTGVEDVGKAGAEIPGLDEAKDSEGLESNSHSAEGKISESSEIHSVSAGSVLPTETFNHDNSFNTTEISSPEGHKDGYTVGDRIVFTKNDRGFWTKFQSPDPSFFVRNGTQAIIQSITPCKIKDRETREIHNTHKIVAAVGGADAREKTSVRFYVKEYPHFQHGYAVTTHKSQGATADGALLKATPYMDAHAFYVALTRHRTDVGVYYSKSDFADFAALVKAAGKVSVKDLAVDYTVQEDREIYWANVQEYKALGHELLSIRTFGKYADKADKAEQEKIWGQYEAVKSERKELAKLILTDWENHRDFIRQGGLTFETLEIAANLRKRPLSRLEAQAQEVVEQYASVAIETRETWRSIRKTHPGIRAKVHPEWTTFEALRDQRGELANQIMQNPTLYRPLLRETALAWEDGTDKAGKNHFGYGIPIIKAQAEAHQSKILQQEMLKTVSSTDPILTEKLQTLLDYVETRDLSASLWKDLHPKLKVFEGTLLSQGFSQEIDEWKDLRITRDQQAAKIVDYWEDYSSLIEKIGMKLDFGKLFEQKEQAIRDLLFKAYKALPVDTISSEMAKLKAACDLKTLMDDETLQGKKTTIAQIYQQGLQPKDIARDASHYEERQVCNTEEDHYYFKAIYSYHQSVAAANGLYRTCLREGEKSRLTLPETPHYPEYLEAVANRNETAMNLLARDDWQECWYRAHVWNLDLNEDTLMTQMRNGQRGKLLDQYANTNSTLVKLLIAREVKDMLAEDQKEQRKATLADLYGRKIAPSTIQIEAKQYDRMVAYANLATGADKQIFSALKQYDEKLTESKRHYATACREAKEQNCKKEDTPAYADFQRSLRERQEMASVAANAGRPHVVEGIAEDIGIIPNTLYKDARVHELGMSHLTKDQPERNEQAAEVPEKPDTLSKANDPSKPLTFSQEAVKKQYTSQEAEALAYLREEVQPEKHSWLSQTYAQNLLKAAEIDPLKALARWQDVADDYSFSPKTQEIKAQSELLKTGESQQDNTISQGQVDIVTLTNNPLPEKRDLADDIPQGRTMETTRQMLRVAVPKRGDTLAPEKPSGIVPKSDAQTAKASRTSKAADRLLAKREQFEEERMPLNQEWVAKFHFYQAHGRFPKPEELETTWWQAERLTAIEGRIYHQNLKQGISMPLADLRDAAREEFAEREVFQLQELSQEGQKLLKSTHLTESQVLHVQQHILFHQDQTGELPALSKIQNIINAVKAHAETRSGQGDQAAKLPDSNDKLAPHAAARLSRQYANLMEQQQLLSGRVSTEDTKAPTAFLSNKDDKMAQLTLQISSAIESQNRRQRSRDRGRGMEL